MIELNGVFMPELPRVLPRYIEMVEKRPDGAAYRCALPPMTIIFSGMREQDGRRWLHLSVCRPAGPVPKWDDVKDMKGIFLGDMEAYMVFPPKARYVNIHPWVLHLFACLDSPDGVLPDFTHGMNVL